MKVASTVEYYPLVARHGRGGSPRATRLLAGHVNLRSLLPLSIER